MDAVHLCQLLIFDLMIVAPAPASSSMPRESPFLDVDQRDFDREIGVWEDASEVDQFVEDVQYATLLGTPSPADDPAAFRVLFDDQFPDDDRFDHKHSIVLGQFGYLITNGSQRAVLDLDQFVARDHIDPECADRGLQPSVAIGIDLFQLTVQ